MYAIIATGGKQYRVEKGDIIDVELLDSQAGEKVEFKEVLFVSTGSAIKVGNPHLPKAVVQGEMIQQAAGPKVFAYKTKERKQLRRKVGHRQKYSRVKITEIIA